MSVPQAASHAPDASLASLRRSTDAIVELRDSLNAAFELIAAELPGLSEGVGAAVAQLSGRRAAVDSSGVNSLSEARTSLGKELSLASDWMRESRAQLHEILGELRPGIGTLLQALADVSYGARQLRLLALNASFVAQRSGDGMRGFAAATNELIEIAAAQLRDAEHVIALVSGVSTRFDNLEALGGQLTSLVDSIEGLSTQTVLDRLIQTFSSIEFRLQDMADRCRSVDNGIGRAVVALQRQDILRQGLEHVEIVAREIVTCEQTLEAFARGGCSQASALEAAEVQRRAGRLCADLFQSISKELRQFLDEVETYLGALTETSKLVNELMTSIVAGQLQGHVEVLRERVARLGQHLTDGTAAQVRRAEMLADLYATVHELPSRLRTFVARHDQVRVLGILVRREDARTGGLFGAKAIIESLEDLLHGSGGTWTGLLADVAHIDGKLKGFALPQVAAETDAFSQLNAELSELERVTHNMVEHVERACGSASQSIVRVSQVAQRLSDEVCGLRSRFELQTRAFADYRAVSVRSERFLAQQGIAFSNTIELPPRVQSLISRFTIVAHKHVAMGTAKTSDTEAEGGSMTLF
jgi:hypothetical protein